ncbi:Pycsar system effector family protein [Kitasatospora fiedleri]|uniref:Pycsar system effector family protein n=1 Tax=Kitasatospora fiedleri TaxID=2991545 RepID=UPI002499D9FE|nr:Pycsar system effector family protein [Kitasatospora fiedleri]
MTTQPDTTTVTPDEATTVDPAVDRALDRAQATVAAEMTRTDAKAAALLSGGGILGAVLTVLAASGRAEPISTALAGLLLAAALVASVLVIRPRLGGTDKASFPHWATRTPQQLRADLAEDRRANCVTALSDLAVDKMTALQRATDLTIAAVLALAIAAVLAAT